MAFVEVIRRSMRPEGRTDLRYAWIKRNVIAEKYDITDIEIRDALQVGENEYKFLSEYRPLQKGDMYFTPDGTVFMKGRGSGILLLKLKDITVPNRMMRETLRLWIPEDAGRFLKGLMWRR